MTYEKGTNTVAVSETEPDLEQTGKEYAPQTSPRVLSTITQDADAVRERKHNIPWLGLGALFISLLTVVASVLILNFVDERPIADLSHLRPASWLSAVLSLNGICLQIALSEGFTIAWWYKSLKSDITHRDLHKVWRHGTSKVAALTAGRRFSYVALATLFIAVLPLNGFMLQNALDVQRIHTSPELQIRMPVHMTVPVGWSGTLNQDGTIAGVNPIMSSKLVYAINGDAHGNTHVISRSANVTGCQVNATYEARKPNVGFHVTCTEPVDVPFDLSPDTVANTTLNSTIFSSQLSWSTDLPGQMKLQTITRKESASGMLGSASPCIGNLQFKQCTLQVALLNQSVTIATRAQNSAADDGPGLIYDSFLSDRGDYSTDALIRELPVLANEIQDGNTTIGALVAALAPMFNGVIIITYVDGKSAIRSEGFYSRLTGLQVFDKPMENPTVPDSPIIGMCNSTTESGRDFSGEILNSIRRLTFYVAESYNSDVTPLPETATFDATEYYPYDAYEVIWAYWLASMAVTVVIVVGVSPLFWSFWLLDGKMTMSPFETARVFSMPAEELAAKS